MAFTCTITSISDTEVVYGVITVTVSITLNGGEFVDYVEYFVDGIRVLMTSDNPYSFIWDTNLYDNGVHRVQAIAVDTLGVTAPSSTILVYSGGTVQGLPAIEVVKTPDTIAIGSGALGAFMIQVDPDGSTLPGAFSWRCINLSPLTFNPSGS
jgi:Bacterial Ig domain